MDLAYVDKLAKENNGVKYLLVRQDLFDRTVNAKGKKTKDSQETVKAFSSMITKRNRPKKISVDKGREETFLQTFLVDHVKQQFSVPTFCGSVWKSWRETPICRQFAVLT